MQEIVRCSRLIGLLSAAGPREVETGALATPTLANVEHIVMSRCTAG